HDDDYGRQSIRRTSGARHECVYVCNCDGGSVGRRRGSRPHRRQNVSLAPWAYPLGLAKRKSPMTMTRICYAIEVPVAERSPGMTQKGKPAEVHSQNITINFSLPQHKSSAVAAAWLAAVGTAISGL